MKENLTPLLDGANKLEDIIEYSSDKRKVSFGLCDFDVFLQEYAIDKTVEIVTMEECKFSDLAFLAELKNLKELHIYYPSESSVSMIDLKACLKIQKLGLPKCNITKIEGLKNMLNLESLFLQHNEISKIQGLENLSRLKELDMSGNRIKCIEGMDNLVGLETLSLMDNKIKKIEGLGNLINLKQLYLLQNCIQEIEGLDHLTNLELLGLSTNNLFHGVKYVTRQELMTYIGHLPKLKSFNAYNFPLPERIYLQHNPDCYKEEELL